MKSKGEKAIEFTMGMITWMFMAPFAAICIGGGMAEQDKMLIALCVCSGGVAVYGIITVFIADRR
ncbi:hypothetical protein [Aminipila sp.]|uniref:hypothetical protein n=1 Tax=Aminipila sp. TaxID=2060095 RepID=UPI0028996BD0|nr:hypothetical protein [Aminipila sp.]